jgi:hypothetical protein
MSVGHSSLHQTNTSVVQELWRQFYRLGNHDTRRDMCLGAQRPGSVETCSLAMHPEPHCASRPRRDRAGRNWPSRAPAAPDSLRGWPNSCTCTCTCTYLLFGLFLRSNNVENPSVHTRLRSHAPSRADCKASDPTHSTSN